MIIGIPKGLLYYKYYPLAETFFKELGCDIITSNDTNKNILNLGVKYCVDEACLPVKVFHGHIAEIKDNCDMIFIPRIMRIYPREYICPKFCGLPEMIVNDIPNMPKVLSAPIYADNSKNLYKSMIKLGSNITSNRFKIKSAFEKALKEQSQFSCGIKNDGYKITVAFVGHPYNTCDNYTNMNLVKKLNSMGVGVITEDFVPSECIDNEVSKLFKRPFWSFARESYGASVYLSNSKKVDGIIYISSFACGIDSVVTELVKDNIDNTPFLILKIDEQTGEAGFNTRIEAFVDMLERRKEFENNISTHGKYISC